MESWTVGDRFKHFRVLQVRTDDPTVCVDDYEMPKSSQVFL